MYTMMQVCRELDITYQTLKFYCNEGLVPGVKRDKNNRRIFDEKDVELCLQGESTIVSRKKMLAKKQETLRVAIKELEDSVAYIDWKQNFYDEVLTGKHPYVSNLIQSQCR